MEQNSSNEESILVDLESAGYVRAKKALAKIDPKILLNQSTKHNRPIWMCTLEDRDLTWDERPYDQTHSLSDEEVEERRADGSLIGFPGAASEEDETKLAAKLELLQNNKHLMKHLVGNLLAKLRVYRRAHSGNPDERITKRHTSSSTDLTIFLRNEVEIYPKMNGPSVCLPWKEIVETRPDDLSPENLMNGLILIWWDFRDF